MMKPTNMAFEHLPLDYVSAAAITHPRDAMAAIASRWRDAADHMMQGKPLADFSIDDSSDRETLAPQLASHAELLQAWAADPEVRGVLQPMLGECITARKKGARVASLPCIATCTQPIFIA